MTKYRTHSCLSCKHQWTSQVAISKHSPAISGERTEQCPVCNAKGIMSSPWHDQPKYRIDRSIPGGFNDHLHTFCPEYAGLPTFRGVQPLLFDTLEAAEATVDHLRVWFPSTNAIPGVARILPITYSVVPVVHAPKGWESVEA